MRRPRLSRLMPVLAAALLLPGLLPGVASAARPAVTSPTPTISFLIGSCWVSIDGGPATTEITGILRKADGTLKGTLKDTSDASGSAELCFKRLVLGGDTLTLKAGGKTIRTLAIHRFALLPNRNTDVLTVKGKPNDKLAIERSECTVDGKACTGIEDKQITIGPKGTFTWNLKGTQDITGGDKFILEWTNPLGDSVGIRVHAPSFTATIGLPTVTGWAAPGTPVTVTVRRAGVIVASGAATARPDSTWTAKLRKNGAEVLVQEGDVLKASVASTATLHADLTAGFAGDGISGVCFPDVDLAADLTDPLGSSTWYYYAHSDGNGNYLLSSLDLLTRAGWTATVRCTDDAGDTIARQLLIPNA
ncbi:MAG: hypothetical protein U0869_15815 [Chloroflexota bacterium]